MDCFAPASFRSGSVSGLGNSGGQSNNKDQLPLTFYLGCYLTSLASGQYAPRQWTPVDPPRAEQAGCTLTPIWYDVESAFGAWQRDCTGTMGTLACVPAPATNADLYPGQVSPTNPFQRKKITFARQ